MGIISEHYGTNKKVLCRLPHGVMIKVNGRRKLYKWSQLCDHLHATHTYRRRTYSALGLFSKYVAHVARSLFRGYWDNGARIKNESRIVEALYKKYHALTPADYTEVSETTLENLRQISEHFKKSYPEAGEELEGIFEEIRVFIEDRECEEVVAILEENKA